jgi:cell fate regulator YaaT (PSP1 superfamily)
MLVTKTEDEQKALQLCQTKVRAKKLPMEVIDAEYQWFVPPVFLFSSSGVERFAIRHVGIAES